VKADGHCHISGPQTAAALEELIQWKHTGLKPEGGAAPESAKQRSKMGERKWATHRKILAELPIVFLCAAQNGCAIAGCRIAIHG
jgi:hypothetical protein